MAGVRKSFELLAGLDSAIRDFSKREQKLEGEFQTRIARERKRRGELIQNQSEQLAEGRREAEAAHQAALAAEEAGYQNRKNHIGRARGALKEWAREQIEDQSGAQKYELQKRMLKAERDREASLAGALAAFEDFKARLAAEGETLGQLEKRARDSFKGLWGFSHQLARAREKAAPDTAADQNRLLADLQGLRDGVQRELERFRGFLIARIFRFLPVWLVVALLPLIALLHRPQFNPMHLTDHNAEIAALAAVGAVLVLNLLAKWQSNSLMAGVANALGRASRLQESCAEKAAAHYQSEVKRLQEEFEAGTWQIDEYLKQMLTNAGNLRVSSRMSLDDKTVRVSARNDEYHRRHVKRLEEAHAAALAELPGQVEAQTKPLVAASEQQEARLTSEHETAWRTLEEDWEKEVRPLWSALDSATSFAKEHFPAWSPETLAKWTPPAQFSQAARFGELAVDLDKLSETNLKAQRLALPGPAQFNLPMLLAFPDEGSMLIESAESGHDAAVGTLNNVILRLLETAPPGRLNFTIIDAVGLGQSFAGVMHLADHEEQLINNRIWTQPGQIEQKLADLNEHMEKVIQMYLRNEYATIAEYNEQAGDIAEKYHFLVVADFPAGFSEVAARRLLSIASSGARCGVYMLIHWDRRHELPPAFAADELKKNCVIIDCLRPEATLQGRELPGTKLQLERPPSAELATQFIHRVGERSKDSSRVEVPFSHIAPEEKELWTEETTNELRVAIGRTGATKLQYLAIGKGTKQHALIAGKTGSGKSTLFHVMITNLALWCSPEQVEFYLVDFKKGVEFKCYANRRLPHARVVAIESDREFGLSVLQRVDDELRRRGDLFRKLGAQDIPGYKRAGGTEPMPRTMLMIDEFQELFTEEDRIAQNASVLLDRIVRQGRAFGIHVVLGSQTLGGAYTVARTTLGQMVIRIALQCNEADAYLIMDDTNPAPRLLSRPGEGIYNDSAGAIQGNSPFQVVWLPDSVRDSYLEKVQQRAVASGKNYAGPIVFEGDAPGEVRENAALQKFLTADSVRPPTTARIWLGSPNSIKGPTEAVFQRQSGNNLLIVGQRDEAILAIFGLALIGLSAQFPKGNARFILLDANAPETPPREFLERVVRAVPHPITLAKAGEVGEIMNGLAAELARRSEEQQEEAPAVFLLINGLQKFSKLRNEDEFSFGSGGDAPPNPGAQFSKLIGDGASRGIHIIAACDTYNNVNRFLNRKALSEFEMRVLFQMSTTDSASLIDNPKANTLGLNRSLFYNEQEGYLEVFRPYALPDSDWLEQAAENLRRLLA